MKERKALGLGLAGFALIIFVAALPPTAEGVTITVPDDYSTIQAAIDAATSGDIVYVAAGTYVENIILKDGVVVQGAGADVTTIDGGGIGSVVTASAVGSYTTLESFTITNGTGSHPPAGWQSTRFCGGGILLYDSSPTIKDCIITGNHIERTPGGSASYGGGIYAFGSSPHFINNIIMDNSAYGGGGIYIVDRSTAFINENIIADNKANEGAGIYVQFYSSPVIKDNTIRANIADWYGGGIKDDSLCSSNIVSNIIVDNSAYIWGGGILTHNWASSKIVNNVIVSNSAYAGGGILMIDAFVDSPVTVVNNTVTGNVTSGSYGAIHAWNASAIIANCIVWGNKKPEGYLQQNTDLTGYNNATYSNIGSGNTAGEGNISAEPMFVDPGANDYRLQEISPCIDAGTNDVIGLLETDFDGNPRIIDGDNDGDAVVDMGAFEYPKAMIEVFIDIKPRSCPNPLNLKSKGVLTIAVLGTEDFEVTDIDPETIILTREGYEDTGVAPIRWSYEDVTTPFEGELCDCHDLNGDGYLDLILKLKTQELVETLWLDLEEIAGETIPLILSGNLEEEAGGMPIKGSDCIKIQETG